MHLVDNVNCHRSPWELVQTMSHQVPLSVTWMPYCYCIVLLHIVDSDVSMQTTCPGPCPVICRTTAGDTDRRMRSIRRSVSPAVLRLLVVLLVLSRLDCGNDCVMIGIPPFRGKNDRHTEVGGVRRRAVRVRSIGRSQTATTTAVNWLSQWVTY